MKRKIILILSVVVFAACDFLDPRPIEDLTTEDLWSHADFGEGILTTVYANLSTDYEVLQDAYTDNAVPAQPGANYLALGNWTVENSPIGEWASDYTNIKYLNLFLENGRDLPYNVTDAYKDSILRAYRYGEAFYLRAWHEWRLLQAYGGLVNGVALGFPIVTVVLDQNDDLDIPRNTYEECVAQIVADCDSAFAILPFDYTSSRDQYLGTKNRGRASGIAAMALKARAYLYAASPAFNNSNEETWLRAAQAAADAITASGGLKDLNAYGNFNTGTNFDNIWVSSSFSSNLWEQIYYPPSLYGIGYINPSQNLVDAFPASDGFPIDQSAAYNANAPYSNRDSRFERFIFYNGTDYNGTIISTYEGGADAPGGLSQLGSRTGYYMKKLLSDKVSLATGNITSDYKFKVFLSKAELYLNYAEAINEAYGSNDNRLGFSAVEVMAKIRKRALGDIDDAYMNQVAAQGKDAFRSFIQNERRVELCFEGHRFWDLRRWNLELNHTVNGMKIIKEGDTYSYQKVEVENHTFEGYMRYIPVPYDQTLIMNNLEQNSGWK